MLSSVATKLRTRANHKAANEVAASKVVLNFASIEERSNDILHSGNGHQVQPAAFGLELWSSCGVEVEGLQIRFHRITLRLPGRQTTLQEFDSIEMQSTGPTNNYASGFIARTGAISDRILISWNERGILEYFSWRNPFLRQG